MRIHPVVCQIADAIWNATRKAARPRRGGGQDARSHPPPSTSNNEIRNSGFGIHKSGNARFYESRIANPESRLQAGVVQW